jgi:hypothetical protein
MDLSNKETCYEIDPRRYRKDRFYFGCLVLFWLPWTPMTLLITWAAVIEFDWFYAIWLIGGYLGVLGIPLAILNRNRKEYIVIQGELIAVQGTGILPKSMVRFPKSNLKELGLGHYNEESLLSLNRFHEDQFPHRITLAAFVDPKDKAVLFTEIASFLRSHNVAFTEKNELSSDTER